MKPDICRLCKKDRNKDGTHCPSCKVCKGSAHAPWCSKVKEF